jgi:hypothetical protein
LTNYEAKREPEEEAPLPQGIGWNRTRGGIEPAEVSDALLGQSKKIIIEK